MNLPATPPQVVSPTALLTGEEARAYAKDLSESTIISPFFKGSVANVLYAMELGKLYSLEPAAILQNVHVFESKGVVKAGLSANLMTSLARKAGHLVTTKANPTKATTTIIRGDTIFAKMLKGDISKEELEHYSTILTTLKEMDLDPKQYAVTEAMWNEDKAVKAELFGKGNWAKYPHAMLAARSKADCVRMACEEVLIQLSSNAAALGEFTTNDGREVAMTWTHTADEIGAAITDDGESFDISTARRPSAASRPERTTVRTADRKPDPAAQAAVDPSQAGWGKAAEPEKLKQSPQADAVRKYVQEHSFEETAKLLDSSLAAPGSSRTGRVEMILNACAELMTFEQVFMLLKNLVGKAEDLVPVALKAIADYSQAAKTAEIMQEIVLDEDESVDAKQRQSQIHTIYSRLKETGRTDDPAPFFDKTSQPPQAREVSLGNAVKIIVQPLLRAAS